MTKKILIVEDEEYVVELIREIFEDPVNYRIEHARGGEEALKIAQVDAPDIVFLDIHLLGLNGFEVCRLIKSNPILSHTKVLIISGMAQNYDLLKAQEVGADDYITKPFTPSTLIQKVEALLTK